MSRLLTDEQKAALLGQPADGWQKIDAEALSRASLTSSEPQRGAVRVTGICLSDRPRMPRGWINSSQGQMWLEARGKAFSRMNSGGQMNFGFLQKNKDK